MKIEKRPMNNMENYLVIKEGEIELPMSSVKTIALMWVFFSVCFLTYVIGMQSSQTQVLQTAYLLKGNITTEKGEPVDCVATLQKDLKQLTWNCTVGDAP